MTTKPVPSESQANQTITKHLPSILRLIWRIGTRFALAACWQCDTQKESRPRISKPRLANENATPISERGVPQTVMVPV